jgi:hypothetical protein
VRIAAIDLNCSWSSTSKVAKIFCHSEYGGRDVVFVLEKTVVVKLIFSP